MMCMLLSIFVVSLLMDLDADVDDAYDVDGTWCGSRGSGGCD